MSDQSAASFAGAQRIHVALAVKDLAASVSFYQTLLGVPPTKHHAAYAKFEPAEPSVNLALNRHPQATGTSFPAHFGIQVKSKDEVERMTARLHDAHVEDVRTEHETECCYAVQDKVWVTDPDGNGWEVFVTLDDAPQYPEDDGSVEESCCSSDCCTV